MGDTISLSLLFSLLSFVTTLFTVLRVGTVVYASNNVAAQNTMMVTSGSPINMGVLQGITDGHDLLRVSWPIKKLVPDRPVSPVQIPQKPASMAKLIMTRHSQRRPRALYPRRPPNLSVVRQSPLVEEV